MSALILVLAIFMGSCKSDDPGDTDVSSDEILVKTQEVINSSYIGNGAQWDAYPNAYLNWNSPISEADWQKMYKRLDYMRPKFMRVMIAAGWKYAQAGGYDEELHLEGLAKILQYCTDNDITVMFGDWGGGMVNAGNNTINEANLSDAARYVDYLINTKNFTCIKYYTMVNEPNGNWSATDGNYDLWKRAVTFFYDKLEERGLTDKLSIAGPDIAIWDTNFTNWITDTERDLGDQTGLYDIHTYPAQSVVRNREYTRVIAAYIDKVPDGKKIVMGELGYKYSPSLDLFLDTENKSRIAADPFAGDDSNMFVSDFFYGIDMANATMQLINVGYSGMIAWSMDDAMHNTNGGNGKDLKVWGFWNILGEELFGGADKEAIRPWFYPSSLLSRYMQTGTQVYKVEIPSKKRLNAIAVTRDGKYMVAVLNTTESTQNINLKFDNDTVLTGCKKFIYAETERPVDSDGFPVPVASNVEMNLGTGHSFEIEKETLVVFTNFDY
ncbi:hypothetical protein FNH22_07850 [Fulvivirga sp. M361]|uniref:hypothetical protein n=1 Tax=Fulvivirga sp. M361 TaxID=2594266 RepID=UPI00117A50D2|nr:hypothetical protein [Fulvivirga sp. M361]TRX59958.1 hypothetical protein FNH22_07850 [Fulvivirga sp. M361]